MKPYKKRLSVIIPTYNESATIALLLKRVIYAELQPQVEKEIWVIDDCSSDNTGEKVRKVAGEHPEIPLHYICLPRNRGKGYAVRTGIGHATGDIIVIQDADLEYDPSDFGRMLPFILSGEWRVVYGSRVLNRANDYCYRSFYWGGRLVSCFVSLLYGVAITDEPTCYKMFEAALLKSIPLREDGFGFCPEITAKVLNRGYRIKEVPISYFPRSISEGKKINWRDGVQALWILFRYRLGKKKVI